MLKRLTVAVVLLGTTVGLFLVLHTGARADGLCEERVFVRGGETSWWPPGVTCTFGDTAQTSVEMHGIWMLWLLVVVTVTVVVVWNRRLRD